MGAQITLQQRLGEIRTRVLRLLWLDGMSRFLAVCLSSAVLICLLDWWLRWDAVAWRVSVTAIFALSTLLAAWWCLWLPFRSRPSNVQLAARVEERFPQLHDRLSNSVAFVESNFDPGIGSPALQQHLADRTEHSVAELDFDKAVETRHVRRDVAVAAVILAGAAMLTGLHRTEAATALGRLIHPLEQRSWPQQTQFVILDPQFADLMPEGETWLQRSAGTTLEFLVVNARGALPSDTHLLIKTGDAPVVSQKLTAELQSVPNEGGAAVHREFARVKLQLREGPVHFRAAGGDDRSMKWVSVRVTTPPRVESFSLTLHPPLCLNQPVVELPAGQFAVRAVVGTRVDIEGRSSLPLDALRLHVRGHSATSAVLEKDDRRFQASFNVAQPGPGAYWFELVDRNGVSHHDTVHYEIDGIAEGPPRIRLVVPSSDISVVPQAVLPLRAEVNDDFGIHRVLLNHRVLPRGTAGGDTAAPPKWTPVSLYESDDAALTQVTVEHAWDLAPLQLKPGTRLSWHLAAGDACTEQTEAYGKSVERSLLIVTPDQKAAELASRETLLRRSLETTLQMQQQIASGTRELAARLRDEQQIDRRAEDRLRRVAQEESEVKALVTGADGIGALAERLLQELETNRLDDATAEHRYRQVIAASSLLEEITLPSLEAHLLEARRIAENARNLPDTQHARTVRELLQSLDTAMVQQQTVEASFQALLELLALWEQEYHLASGLGEIIEAQTTLNVQTAEIGRRTFTTTRDRLPELDREQLTALAQRQAEQAEAFDQWRQRLEQSAFTPESAAARAQLEERPIHVTMHRAAERLGDNDISTAALLQQQLLERLHSLNDLMQGRTPPSTKAQPSELQAEADEIQRLSKELAALRKATREAATAGTEESGEQVADLARRQTSLRETAETSAERLRAQQAITPASAVARAAAEMRAAESRLQSGAAGRAVTHQHEAQRQLGQAARELGRWLDASRDAQRQANSEVLAIISSLIERQTGVNQETGNLAAEWAAVGSWNRSRLKALSGIRDAQSGVVVDARRLAEHGKTGSAGRFAITQAAELLEQAASRLEQRDVGAGAQQLQREGLELLVTVHQVLESSAAATPQAGDSQPPGNQPDWDELRAVRVIQELLRRRTAQLQQDLTLQSLPAGEDGAADALERIAQQQQALHRLARDAGKPLLLPELSEPPDALSDPFPEQSDLMMQAKSAARSAVDAMQAAADQLAARESGETTQQFQAEAIAELDSLLELARRHGSLARQSADSPAERPAQDSSQSPAEATPAREPPEAPVASAQPGGDPGEAPSGPAEGGAGELIRRQALVEGVWGHLPPAVREQVLNMRDDRPLPAYEDLVHQYFETLAE